MRVGSISLPFPGLEKIYLITKQLSGQTFAGLYAGCRPETKPTDTKIKAQALIKTVVCIVSHVPLWIIFWNLFILLLSMV